MRWTPECKYAFNSLKANLCSSPVLSNSDFNREFILQTDASDQEVDAVLSQIGEDDQERPTVGLSYHGK